MHPKALNSFDRKASDMQVYGKTFVVTGGGNGIGRQVVLGLLRKGATVSAVDLNADALEGTQALATGTGTLSTHVVNVTDRQAVAALLEDVTSLHGHVDGLINVAGIIHRFVPVADLSFEDFERVMNVNLWGTVNMCKTFLPALRCRPAAAILNVSSLSALLPFAGQTFYGATKAAVKQFSEGLYQELSGTAVAVTTVFPGNISTDISGNSGVKAIDPKGRKAPSTTPEATAAKIIQGLERGSFRVLVGTDAKILDAAARMSSRIATAFIGRQMKSVL
ncbi:MULTISPECIES: SDR family NAD(P)-dependent oxidoreductase [unclassified Arthrobacter]|uniref:SDR family NAD(P)-dependent oxidoreductase n=1 Tax=unclassified Arthrobacter TaxID=235627 RepID=UPI000B30A880|nr:MULTISPECIES: SDR family oxidoreductase [unclassified Arthrobacter]MDQ0826089.1 short-subunit dehydrogenase [Arthrobacter sp. B2I5]